MRFPTSLTVAIVATASLWAVALFAYLAGQRTEITVGAFVRGCVAAWVQIIKVLDKRQYGAGKSLVLLGGGSVAVSIAALSIGRLSFRALP